MRVRTQTLSSGAESHLFWCPGCQDLHRIETPPWTRTGPESFEPSIKVGGTQWSTDSGFHKPTHSVDAGVETICHSFLRDGVWDFLSDSTHHLAGQRVPMVEIPADLELDS